MLLVTLSPLKTDRCKKLGKKGRSHGRHGWFVETTPRGVGMKTKATPTGGTLNKNRTKSSARQPSQRFAVDAYTTSAFSPVPLCLVRLTERLPLAERKRTVTIHILLHIKCWLLIPKIRLKSVAPRHSAHELRVGAFFLAHNRSNTRENINFIIYAP